MTKMATHRLGKEPTSIGFEFDDKHRKNEVFMREDGTIFIEVTKAGDKESTLRFNLEHAVDVVDEDITEHL